MRRERHSHITIAESSDVHCGGRSADANGRIRDIESEQLVEHLRRQAGFTQ